MRVGIRRRGGFFSLRSTFAQVGIDGRKLDERNFSHIDDYCPRRARFRRDGLKGESPITSPKRSDRRGQRPLWQTCSGLGSPASLLHCGPVRAACSLSLHRAAAKQLAVAPSPLRRYANSLRLRAFPASAQCELTVAPSPLRPYASSLRPEDSMLPSSASAPSCVSSFANT